MNEDKTIEKLFKYITIKSELSNTIFRNIYGVSIEDYIQSNLINGEYWIDFEQGNYKVLNPNSNRKEIQFKDGKRMEIRDWWYYGVGKLKKKLFEYDNKAEFLGKYCNFSGTSIADNVIDEDFCENYENGIFYDVDFEDCEFKDLYRTDGFKSSYYKNCKFTNVEFDVPFLNNSYFNKCEFNKCRDLRSQEDYLEGEEWNELVNKDVSVDFSNNIFNRCNFGFNSVQSLIFGNTFNFTDFKMCKFSHTAFYYNEFNECNFENVSFENSGNKIISGGVYDVLFCNKQIKCSLKNVDYSKAILLNQTFEANNYDNNTEFSLKYYDDFKKIQTNLNEEELNFMNQGFEDMDEKEYIRIYMNLYHNLFKEYKSTVMTKEAYEFYYIYKCLEKDLNLQLLKECCTKDNIIKWVKDWILYKTCGFGERPSRVLRLSLYLILCSSLLYLFLGIDNNKQPILYIGVYHNLDTIFPQGYNLINVTVNGFISDYVTCVYFSIITLATIGYGDYIPLTFGSRVLVCFQAITSMILVALFMGTMIRKSFRD